MDRLILGSSSPRRRRLLKTLVADFEVVPSSLDERLPLEGEDPLLYCLELARQKSADVASRCTDGPVLGADTVVTIDGMILGKPRDRDDARSILALLRGRWHRVITAIAVRCPDEQVGAVTARVKMLDFDDDAMEAYIATGEPMDKAGAYAVQGQGGALVERVCGCYNAVIGLPLCLTAALLGTCGYPVDVSAGVCDHR